MNQIQILTAIQARLKQLAPVVAEYEKLTGADLALAALNDPQPEGNPHA